MNSLCEISGIPRRTYYYCKNNTIKLDKDMYIVSLIEKMPKLERLTYGYKRKAAFLSSLENTAINHKRVQRICKEFGLQAQIRRNKHPKGYYEQRKEEQYHLPKNILNRNFKVDKPLIKLATDVSYFRVKNGWLYLSPIMDLFNGEIISYKCSHFVNEKLATDTINNISSNINIEKAVIQTDRGSTYTAHGYRNLLNEKQLIHSMN